MVPSVEQRLPRVAPGLSWLLLGGGSDPLSNQISLAQDLELASGLLGGRGLTLFASGVGALTAVERDARASDTLNRPAGSSTRERVASELAALLGPPGALSVSYQPTQLAIDAPATRDHVIDALRGALETGREPLLVFAASHGQQGTLPRENSLALWGGWSLDVEDVAALLDVEGVRPTRWLVTACYGGGFAELAFTGGNPQRGPRPPEHCGLFAAPADDESSGCDPNPDRRAQESYTIHFLAALRGQDKQGTPRLAQVDLDQDTHISLAEAHAWARIHSRSFDVPTSTSERFLREYVGTHEPARVSPGELEREELSVQQALSRELELEDETTARAKLRELERILDDAAAQLDDAQRIADDAFGALRIAVLERFPLLDHSWDPRALTLAEREGPAILQLLTESELSQGNAQASRELAEAVEQHDAVRVARARVLRLVRAFENLRLAGALSRRGGPRWAHYEALRACERWVPALRPASPSSVP